MVKKSIYITHSNIPIAIPIDIDDSVGGIVVAEENTSRISITIQNTGLAPCLIRLGNTVSSSEYNLILSADTGLRNGHGGFVTFDNYQGIIKGITESGGTTTLAVLEEISKS